VNYIDASKKNELRKSHEKIMENRIWRRTVSCVVPGEWTAEYLFRWCGPGVIFHPSV